MCNRGALIVRHNNKPNSDCISFVTIFRLLLAVLIKHHDLAHVILGLVEHGQGDAGKIVLPKSIVELLRVVGQVKRSLIKVCNCLGVDFQNWSANMNIVIVKY